MTTKKFYSQNSKVDPSFTNDLPALTPRELEVLEWVARGKTNEEIGCILNLRPRTAAKHLEHIFVKLGVGSRTAAVVQYLTSHRQTDPHLDFKAVNS